MDPSLPPSGNFDLRNWKITLPVDSNGGYSGTAREVQNLSNYQHPSFFFTASDAAMVFRAPVEGATTSGSNYARSELREMNGTARAAWNLSAGGVMTATLEVDQVPTRFDGTLGKVVVGQIHGQDDELVRLYWDNNKTYFVNDQAGSGNSETKFYFYNSAGQQPNISLDERFAYVIDAKGNSLEVTVYADGDVYKSVTAINSVWQSDTFYFKAGTYLGVNETQGTGWGQTSFYDLRFNHTDTALTPPAFTSGPAPAPEPPPTQGPAPAPTPSDSGSPGQTINGTNAANSINGTAGNDTINAMSGNDTVHGLGGADTINGGTGTDLLYGDAGADRLFGNDGWDTLIGGAGADTLSGGAGGDKFRFDSLSDSAPGAADVITAFSASEKDKIVLSQIDANAGAGGDQAFRFIGTSAFSHAAGQLRSYQSNGDTFIQGDVNGDAVADLLIMIDASVSLASTDFVL